MVYARCIADGFHYFLFSIDNCTAQIINITPETGNGDFFLFRTILWTPTNIKETMQKLKEIRPNANYEFVDPYTYFDLLKQKMKITE